MDFGRGNLATRSLISIVDPALLIKDSEYLDSHLVAVPNSLVKGFMKSYETISPMVVPRSSIKISSDDEFTLFMVTTFKKYSQEFIHKCRESKWTPRDFKFVENGQEEEKKETERVGRDEKKLWGEALRLGRTGWGESVMIWVHVLALRVFVETVLRYGLPLDFVCGLVKVSPVRIYTISSSKVPYRRVPNSPKKSSIHSIQPTLTWLEML